MDYMKLKETLSDASWYLQHLLGCEIDQTDFCTCEMREAKINLRKAYEELCQ